MSNEHTPGPWYPKIGEQLGMVISDTASVPVAAVYDKKDTNLVAEAPELLRCLIDAEEILSAIDRRMPEGLIDKPTLTCIRVAIKKAKGL